MRSYLMARSRSDKEPGKKRRKSKRSFPVASFKDSAELAEAMAEIAGGARQVRRVTLFDHLGRSPESGPSRQSVTNSSRHGLTEGGYQAEALTLTPSPLTLPTFVWCFST